MQITPVLQAALPGEADTLASVSGDTITVDGTGYDLSAVGEGDTATWADTPLVGAITRTGGVIHVSVRWLYDPATALPVQPAAAALSVTSGAVPDPVARA